MGERSRRWLWTVIGIALCWALTALVVTGIHADRIRDLQRRIAALESERR